MHGAQRIGGGEQEGDKGSTGSGGIGKKRHHELNTKIIQGTTDTNTSNTNKRQR